MGWLALVVLALIVLALIAVRRGLLGTQSDGYPYTKNQALFSPAERSFLGVLEQAIGSEYRIFGKVRVADVASVKPMSNRSTWQRAFNRISAKHVDFMLCEKGDLSIVAAIELDDRSHQQRKRQERDAFLVGLFKAISLPLIRIPAQRAYSVPQVRAAVLGAINARQESVSEHPRQLAIEPALSVEQPALATPQESTSTETPLCPKCSAPMVRRQAKAGANAGEEFWGCSTFPKCRSMITANA